MAETKDIADILRKRDPEKYKHIIKRAELNGYHDFKHDKIPDHPEYAETACPKVQLAHDLSQFPELDDIRQRVMKGEFDERPDDEDAKDLRLMLLDDDAPNGMFTQLGLDEPTEAERFLHKKNKRRN